MNENSNNANNSDTTSVERNFLKFFLFNFYLLIIIIFVSQRKHTTMQVHEAAFRMIKTNIMKAASRVSKVTATFVSQAPPRVKIHACQRAQNITKAFFFSIHVLVSVCCLLSIQHQPCRGCSVDRIIPRQNSDN
ncbi:hypothetical protein EGW08_011001 [Elysia chlorotica]|uniref:Transmembrane protein n=1 Tax=Elysia chlorotica TaxID=188477 RepID=A0A3S1C2Q2_ELYCH|nr:hypothetical protein EGW08_011001 [Elysia chlorotica]